MEETHLDSAFLGPLGQTSWTVDIAINGVFLTFKVDTGAEVTAISEQAYRALGRIKLENVYDRFPTLFQGLCTLAINTTKVQNTNTTQ